MIENKTLTSFFQKSIQGNSFQSDSWKKHLDGAVSRGRDDVVEVKVDDVDGCSMAEKNSLEVDLLGRHNVPHCNGPILWWHCVVEDAYITVIMTCICIRVCMRI